MRDLTFDVQPSIDALRSLKSDLEVYYWERRDDGSVAGGTRYQVGFWIRLLTDRTAALEGIVMHAGTPRLLLRDVSDGEHEALEQAAAVLDQWIHEDEAFERVRGIVASVLAAVDRLALRIAGGSSGRPATTPVGNGQSREA